MDRSKPGGISELIAAVEFKTSLPKEQVLFALELALEQAVCEYFGLPECQVDVEDRTLTAVSRVPLAGKSETGGLICSELPLNMLHKDIIKRCRHLFTTNLVRIETVQLYEKWKRRVHLAVEGAIFDVDAHKVRIRLGDNVCGLMLKPEWVQKEVPLYQRGSVFRFYVSKVLQKESSVTVHLSRGSKNLPAALLREKLPWTRIRAVKRIRGKKTWLTSNIMIDTEIIRDIQRELKGETIEIKKC